MNKAIAPDSVSTTNANSLIHANVASLLRGPARPESAIPVSSHTQAQQEPLQHHHRQHEGPRR
ncbi:hypothetical protein ACFU5O_36815 [Streptomyces sp. NPDC057445]|uniref:hypothetical protein n=1 Tax=Streptomyces sp. NPDC057445 TaxID=3346136 RepID=UPI003686519A